METITAISSEWLEARMGDEKAFSVAAFEPRFVERQWIAIVRRKERTDRLREPDDDGRRRRGFGRSHAHRAKRRPTQWSFCSPN